jgi:hypothetical protein
MDELKESQEIRQAITDLADEMGEDSSGDWGERDPEGVGWERACKHYAEKLREILRLS